MSRYNDLISSLGKATVFCNNLGFGEQGAVLNQLDKAVVICSDIEKARKLKSQLDALQKENVLIDDFDNPYTVSKFQSNDNRIDLLKALYKLSVSNAIVVTTVQILHLNIPKLENFNKHIIKLEKNNEYVLEDLEKQLILLGYKKVDSVTVAGEFARRGDIIDIFNVVDNEPTRLDFFDTQVYFTTHCRSFQVFMSVFKA